MPQQIPADAPTPYSDPIILYGQTSVTPGSGSAPNTDALSNPDNLDMELLEVRWRIYANPTPTKLVSSLVAGMAIGVKFDLGSLAVVDADVPLSSFGTARDIDEPGFGTNLIYPDPTNVNITTTPYSYRWRLKYPLLIPGGAVLTPVYSHLSQTPFPVTIDTMYLCRQRPPGQRRPDKVKVPWVGSYNSTPFDNLAGQAAGQDFSSESDLYNPFDVPLEVSRLAGSCVLVETILGVTQVIEWNGEHRFQLGQLRARSKRGNELARASTPFNTLFPIEWRVWDIPQGWHLMPGEYYKTQLNVAAVSYTPATNQTGSVQFMVAMTGFREVPVADFVSAAFAEPEPEGTP